MLKRDIGKQDEGIYKVCPNYGTLIKQEDAVCSNCGMPYYINHNYKNLEVE